MATNKDQNKAKANLKAAREQSIKQTAESVEANSGLTAPTGSALKSAQKEGIAEAVKESAKDAYQSLTDGGLPGAPAVRQFSGMDEIMQYAGILDLGLDQFRQAVEKGGPVPEEKVAGLLELERAGRNRTPYVDELCKRLGGVHPREVTAAGPDYTNDISHLKPLPERK